MLRRSAFVLALVACGDRGEPTASGKSHDAAVAPGPVTEAPHSGQISVIAVTDDASAAFTLDDNNDLRFWPTLDGTREPVVVRGRPAIELAIAHERDGYVAALLDTASGIEIVRLAKDGATRGRQLLPAEPGFVEVAAGAAFLLARRSDHAIVRLDATASGPRVLEAEPGDQILAIAARRTKAFAGIADRDRPAEIHAVREIGLAGGLAWGAPIELPVPLAAPIALSPSGSRLAGLSARTGAAIVIDLLGTPRVIASDVAGSNPDEHVLGFLDDERVVFRGGVVVSAPQITAVADPWSGTRSQTRTRVGRNTIVSDDVVVGGHATHLLIANPDRNQFLGYRDVGVGLIRVTGAQLTLYFGNRVLWLDDKLESTRAKEVLHDVAGGLAVDERRLLKGTYSYKPDGRSNIDVTLFDAETGREEPVGSWANVSNLAYDPSTKVFALSGYEATVARAQLDLATGEAKKLRPLKARAESSIELFDPAVADGTIATAYIYDEHGARLETFVDGKGAGAIAPATTVVLPDMSIALGFDRAATFYSAGVGPRRAIYAHRAGKLVTKLETTEEIAGGIVDRQGTKLALYTSSHVFVIDMAGKVLWRAPAWSINLARFTEDGRTLLVNTQGGILALDAATGERRATGCGWGFGLSRTEPPMTIFLAPVVCAEES